MLLSIPSFLLTALLPGELFFISLPCNMNYNWMDKLIAGGDFVDIVHKQKIIGNSKKVTLGDPKDFSNRRSDQTVNTQNKPQKPL